jgi:hypothetical protein
VARIAAEMKNAVFIIEKPRCPQACGSARSEFRTVVCMTCRRKTEQESDHFWVTPRLGSSEIYAKDHGCSEAKVRVSPRPLEGAYTAIEYRILAARAPGVPPVEQEVEHQRAANSWMSPFLVRASSLRVTAASLRMTAKGSE